MIHLKSDLLKRDRRRFDQPIKETRYKALIYDPTVTVTSILTHKMNLGSEEYRVSHGTIPSLPLLRSLHLFNCNIHFIG
jgi:hypothetical protein